MKKNNKGFTLIELLAVIVVLAVIMVIATQQINQVIKKNTADSFKSSLDMVAKQAKTYYASEGMDPSDAQLESMVDYNTSEYTIEYDSSKICLVAAENGKFKGIAKDDFGKITFDRDKIIDKTNTYEFVAGTNPKLCVMFSGGSVGSYTTTNSTP